MSTHRDSDPASGVILMRGSEVMPEPVNWLWNGWLAEGKLHLIAGQAGTGKTTVALHLAAIITSGGDWPDGTTAECGDVVIWSAEDDIEDTIAPRMISAGADMDRVHFVRGKREGKDVYAFDPAVDLRSLNLAIAKIHRPALVIVDPIVSAVAGNAHRNAEVRRGIQPLVDIAINYRCAVMGVTHFSKGTSALDPIERVTGSLAFSALARVVLVVASAPEKADTSAEKLRVLARAKSNIGPDDGGYTFCLEQAPLTSRPEISASHVRWVGTIAGSASDVLNAFGAQVGPHQHQRASALTDAQTYLFELLAARGALPVDEIRAAAESHGHSWATLRRAKQRLNITPTKQSMTSGWAWELPKALKSSEDAQPQGMSIFTTDEHLRPD